MAEMVELIAPEGTVVNCRFPASCGFAPGVGGQLTAVAQDCIARMLAAGGKWDFVNAVWAPFGGGGAGYWIGGHNQYGGVVGAAVYDLFGAGGGATPYRDGNNSGGAFHNAKSCISDVEWIEMYYPFLYLARKHGTDSGGYGKFRGGMTVECVQMVYGTSDMSVDYMPTPKGGEVAGQGLFGGYPRGNVAGGSMILLAPSTLEKMAEGVYPVSYTQLASWGMDAHKSSEFSMERHLGGIRVNVPEYSILGYYYPSGCGYGDPLDRDPQWVVRDLKNEAIFYETAAKVYGVVIDPETLEIDLQKTEQRRQEIRNERLSKGERIGPSEGLGKIEPRDRKHVLMRIHECLEVVEKNSGEKVISCIKCGQELGPVGDNYKRYTLRWTKDVRDMKPVPEGETSINYYQEYICPGCGTLLQVDTWCPMLDDDEPLWDIDVKV